VLVVEDELMLLRSVVAGLGRLPGIEVVGASTVAQALQEIQVRAPALIISDIDLPDRSGIELLGELGARGLKPHVVFVSAYVKAYRPQIPPHAGVEVLEKPVSLEQLRTLVTQRLRQPSSESSPFGVSDYLQLASMGHHSVLIEVSGAGDSGSLVVVQGEAWSAQDEHGAGLDAFRRLLLARAVMVRCQTFQGDAGPRTLEGTAEALLLESARFADEARAGFTELELEDAQATAPAEAQPSRAAPAPTGRSSETFEELFERGVEASLKKRHAEALAAFRAAAQENPADLKTQANIQRLEQLLRQDS
jgi:CheY-like chemotaxis protein